MKVLSSTSRYLFRTRTHPTRLESSFLLLLYRVLPPLLYRQTASDPGSYGRVVLEVRNRYVWSRGDPASFLKLEIFIRCRDLVDFLDSKTNEFCDWLESIVPHLRATPDAPVAPAAETAVASGRASSTKDTAPSRQSRRTIVDAPGVGLLKRAMASSTRSDDRSRKREAGGIARRSSESGDKRLRTEGRIGTRANPEARASNADRPAAPNDSSDVVGANRNPIESRLGKPAVNKSKIGIKSRLGSVKARLGVRDGDSGTIVRAEVVPAAELAKPLKATRSALVEKFNEKKAAIAKKILDDKDKLASDSRSVYVNHVHLKADDTELSAHFKSCGEVERCTIIRDKITNISCGFAYIQFKEEPAVEKALELNESMFRKRKIYVSRKRTNIPLFNAHYRGRGRSYTGRRGRGGYRGRSRGRNSYWG